VDPVTRRVWHAAASLGAVLACAEWAGPELGGPRLAVVPVFGAGAGTVLLNDLDQLRVVVTGSGGARAGVVVADTTVPVDAAGNATLTVPVLLLGGTAQLYDVQLQGIRSSDGVVLYSGSDTVTVQAGRLTRVDSVPVSYLGPCQIGPCFVTLAPQNVTLKQAGSLVMAVSVDSLGVVPVPNVPVRLTNLTPGLIGLASDLAVTALSGTSCGAARIAASIPGASDTLRLGVDAPVTIPAVLFAGDSSGGLSSGVFCQNTNGTGRFPVSRNGASGDVNPRYSPDRQRVAFAFRPTGGSNVLFVTRWAGDSEFIAVSDTSAYRPRWSPDGAHLAFECGDGVSPGQDVCVFPDANIPVFAFASAPRIFVTDSVPTRSDGPSTFAWDPLTPGRIAFVRDILVGGSMSSAIYLANFDGSGIVQLTLKPIDLGAGVLQIRELDWSPRGDVIVFSATDPLFQTKLYAINRDGTGLRRFTTGGDYDSHPVVSPDGAQVLFIRSLASGCSLDYWRIRIDGTGAQQLSNETACDVSVTGIGYDWSPDGRQIALVGILDHRIYAVPAATTAGTYFRDRVLIGRAPDATGVVNDMQPSWRP